MMIIQNAKIITPNGIVFGNCFIKNGVIEAIDSDDETWPDAEIIDVAGSFLAPGLIDLQRAQTGM